MNLENKKNDKIVIGLIITSVVLLLLSFIAPLLFTEFTEDPRFDFNKTGAIGDTIGGLMNPFIALAGVFITFLAFYMQLKANQIQISLFNKNQTEQTRLLKEQMFFRLLENINQRIINFTSTEIASDDLKKEEKEEFVSYKALDNLIKRFFYKIDYKCIDLGRRLLATIPEKLDNTQYFKILRASFPGKFPTNETMEELKQSLISRTTYEERWEYIKTFIGSTDSKNTDQNEALKSIGHVQFYKIDFKHKENIYISCYDELYKNYGGFMDGYTKNISYLMNFIDQDEKNDFFIDYFKSNISTQELILIYYFCASRKSSQKFREQIKKYQILDDLYLSRDRFIDSPSQIELEIEIQNILKKSINR
ncbi:MAG: putative phage abortive infection protein [Flavobacteriaceae bacterium]|nr:putative phage abortive infection protein [Flavobacteriaceae bacterium]